MFAGLAYPVAIAFITGAVDILFMARETAPVQA